MLSLLDPSRRSRTGLGGRLRFPGGQSTSGSRQQGPLAPRPFFDGFWARVQEADVAVTYHACDDPYRYELASVWGWGNVNMPARHIPAEQRLIAGMGRPMHDMVASMILRGLFERFPASADRQHRAGLSVGH